MAIGGSQAVPAPGAPTGFRIQGVRGNPYIVTKGSVGTVDILHVRPCFTLAKGWLNQATVLCRRTRIALK